MEWSGGNLLAAECGVSFLSEFVLMIYELMFLIVNYI